MTDNAGAYGILDSTAVVIDTTVLSNYARTGSVGWLTDVLAVPVTVPAVQAEVRTGYREGYDYLAPVLARFERVDEAGDVPADAIGVVPSGVGSRAESPAWLSELDRGEAHALSGAIPGGVLATDDLDARTITKGLDVTVTGSIGILAYGVERDRLSLETADGWLRAWEEYGFYSPVDSVAEVLQS